MILLDKHPIVAFVSEFLEKKNLFFILWKEKLNVEEGVQIIYLSFIVDLLGDSLFIKIYLFAKQERGLKE